MIRRILPGAWLIGLLGILGYAVLVVVRYNSEQAVLYRERLEAERYATAYQAVLVRDMPKLWDEATASWRMKHECPSPGESWAPTKAENIALKRLADRLGLNCYSGMPTKDQVEQDRASYLQTAAMTEAGLASLPRNLYQVIHEDELSDRAYQDTWRLLGISLAAWTALAVTVLVLVRFWVVLVRKLIVHGPSLALVTGMILVGSSFLYTGAIWVQNAKTLDLYTLALAGRVSNKDVKIADLLDVRAETRLAALLGGAGALIGASLGATGFVLRRRASTGQSPNKPVV